VDVVTPKGTVKNKMPPTDEALQLLSGHEHAVFMGELYAVDKENRPQSYMTGSHIIKSPDSGQDNLLRISIFDVVYVDGKKFEEESIMDKMKIVEQIFGKGKTIHPAITVEGTIDEAEDLWKRLEPEGWEGLVVHAGADIFKVKPIQSFDLVVVAIDKSDKFTEQIGAVLVAWTDKEHRYRLNGSVGGGFTDSERIWLLEWAKRNIIFEDENHIWVNPFAEPLVVEVQALEVNQKMKPAFKFEKGKYVVVEDQMSGVLRFPQYIRMRPDMDPEDPNARVEQVGIQGSMIIKSEQLSVGQLIKTVNGAVGQIVAFSPRHGELGDTDLDVVVKWKPPLWDTIEISELHPSEISEILL
jgi:ATP-dependent DNA ligase